MLRDYTRDDICENLQHLGVEARLAEPGVPEERITSWHGTSLGVIDINGEAIKWVSVKTTGGFPYSPITYYQEYGILTPVNYNITITSARRRQFAVFGRVLNIAWNGNDWGLGITRRLNIDRNLERSLIRASSPDLKLVSHPDYDCWTLEVQERHGPKAGLWACYLRIANIVAGTSATTEPFPESVSDAFEVWTRAIERDPTNIDARIQRGIAYAQDGRYLLAVQDFSRAIALDPFNSDAYHNRGVAYEKLGHEAEAARDFKRADELDAASET